MGEASYGAESPGLKKQKYRNLQTTEKIHENSTCSAVVFTLLVMVVVQLLNHLYFKLIC